MLDSRVLLVGGVAALFATGCSSESTDATDSGADTSTDAGADTGGGDASADAAPDTAADAGGDTSADTQGDAATDAIADAPADAPEDTAPDVIEGPAANLRIVHLSQSAPALELWVDGARPADGAPFDSFAYLETGPPLGNPDTYIAFSPVSHQAAILPDGGELADAFVEDTWNLRPDAWYTVYVQGVWGSDDPADSVRIGVIVDDPSAPAEDLTRMRFVHAAPGVGAATITIGETVLADGLEFGFFNPDYVDAPIGTYDLTITLDGGEVFTPSLTVSRETMNVFLVGESLDDLALVTLNQTNALTMYERR